LLVDRQNLNGLLERFEEAWQGGTLPRIEDFAVAIAAASADGSVRRESLEELVKIDLQYRWSQPAGQAAPLRWRLEDYVARYQELGRLEQLSCALIGEEYRVRHWWGDRPAIAEYEARFPQQGPVLRELLAKIAAELPAPPGPTEGDRIEPSDRAGSAAAPPLVSTAGLMDTLRQSGIVPPNKLDELGPDVPSRFPDARMLGRALLQRNWLTPYQLNQLLQGCGGQLVVGQYLLLERLGEGGAGQVFKARHQKMNRDVAVKLLRKELLDDAEVLARFYREIHIVSQLDHPNVVHAYDAGPAGSSHFLALEYVEGTDLGRLVKQGGRLPVEQACEYIRQAACGLAYAHERGLVHRDIKPHNLIMSLREGLIKVADLGLARLQRAAHEEVTAVLHGSAGSGTLTPENAVMLGTTDYMAPEQALDFHAADIRADIYSLGCTFYYLLTGQPPFAGGALAEKLMKHQQVEPAGVEQVRPDVPAGVRSVLRKMLAKKPAHRYQTPAEVVGALAPFCPDKGPTHASQRRAEAALPTVNPQPRKPRLRRRWLLATAAVLVSATLIATCLLVRPSPTARVLPAHSVPATPARSTHLSPVRLDDLKLRAFPDLPTEVVQKLGKASDAPLQSLTFRRDGTLMAGGGRDGAIHLWDSGDGHEVGVLKAAADAIHALAFTPDGRLLASASAKEGLKLWLVAEQQEVPLPLPTSSKQPCYAVAVSPDGRYLAAGDRPYGQVSLYDVQNTSAAPRSIVDKVAGHVVALAFAPPHGRTLATAHFDQTVSLWNVASGKKEVAVPGTPRIGRIAFAPDGRSLLLGSDHTPQLQLWDTSTPKPQPVPQGQGYIRFVAFAPDSQKLLWTAGGQGLLWARPDAEPKDIKKWLLPGSNTVAALASDRKHVAIARGDNGVVYIVRLLDDPKK
jgi:serine/threonine protein kinase